MMTLVYIALGGGAGAVGRHLVNYAALRVLGADLPWGTLVVNIIGSFFMGLVVGAMEGRLQLSDDARLFITTGFLGGFTTFSAFSLDAVRLLEAKGVVLFGAYALASVTLSIAGLMVGLVVARTFGSAAH